LLCALIEVKELWDARLLPAALTPMLIPRPLDLVGFALSLMSELRIPPPWMSSIFGEVDVFGDD